jgi:pimeloyl-ACP methyl ester carboxylesterase
VLYVEGDESFLRLPDADLEERLGVLGAERAVIRGSAHHPHLERPQALAEVLVAFLRRAERVWVPSPAGRGSG